MVFSSSIFLYVFLPVTLLLYGVAVRSMRNSILLLASLMFYAWGEGFYVALMLVSIIMNYGLGLWIDRVRGGPAARGVIALAVVFNIGLLAWFKYANFLAANLNVLLGGAGLGPVHLDPVHLPIGISFFTFQALTYVVDVHRGHAKVERNPLHVALYISLFPQLIAGPIVRFRDIARQLTGRRVSLEDFAYGVRRFIMGLGKKILIANIVSIPCDYIFSAQPHTLSLAAAWFGCICFLLQVYFDFSGYSDMAIGLCRMFGFRIRENFRFPYISRSVTEFWQRWHISLSTWFRDYLYKPLGGSRCPPLRTHLNLVAVFFLCGLWHGAEWHFAIWGIIHGMIMLFERWGLLKLLGRAPAPVGHFYLLMTLLVTVVLFRADTMPQVLGIWKAMFGLNDPALMISAIRPFLDWKLAAAMVAGAIGSVPIVPWLRGKLLEGPAEPSLPRIAGVGLIANAALILILLGSVYQLTTGTSNPFIYFRF